MSDKNKVVELYPGIRHNTIGEWSCKKCGSFEWRIFCDHKDPTQIKSFQCAGCEASIKIEMQLITQVKEVKE